MDDRMGAIRAATTARPTDPGKLRRPSSARRAASLVVATIVGLLSVGEAAAQRVVRPIEERPMPAEPLEAAPLDRPDLPPIPAWTDPPVDVEPDTELRFFVDGFDIVGSTVFSQEELAAATADYTGRAITSGELLEARDAVSELYLEAGYRTSGAIIPDQTPAAGRIRIEVVEGELADVVIEGAERFRESHLRARIARAARAPVHVPSIERALVALELDPLIERLSASLEPGAQLGESVLILRIDEGRRFRAWGVVSNDRTAALGSWGGGGEMELANAFGIADRLRLYLDTSAGITDVAVDASAPVHPAGTRVRLAYRYVSTEVQDRFIPVTGLEAFGSWQGFTAAVSQPIVRTPSTRFEVSLEFEHIRTTSLVRLAPGTDPICLVDAACEATIVPLRLVAEWSQAWPVGAVATRSQLSFGLGVLGASGGGPAARGHPSFVTWVGQISALYQLPEWSRSTRLSGRLDLQASSDPLAPAEQITLGGLRTVRGYPENTVIRDAGVSAGFEVQLPLYRSVDRTSRVDLVPFVDVGHAWNRDDAGGRIAAVTLASAGVGGRWTWRPRVQAELFWGAQLTERVATLDPTQDAGIHVRIRLGFF